MSRPITLRPTLSGERVFLNVVCADAVDRPTMGVGKDEEAAAAGGKAREGVVVTLPHIVGPPRREKAPGAPRRGGRAAPAPPRALPLPAQTRPGRRR